MFYTEPFIIKSSGGRYLATLKLQLSRVQQPSPLGYTNSLWKDVVDGMIIVTRRVKDLKACEHYLLHLIRNNNYYSYFKVRDMIVNGRFDISRLDQFISQIVTKYDELLLLPEHHFIVNAYEDLATFKITLVGEPFLHNTMLVELIRRNSTPCFRVNNYIDFIRDYLEFNLMNSKETGLSGIENIDRFKIGDEFMIPLSDCKVVVEEYLNYYWKHRNFSFEGF